MQFMITCCVLILDHKANLSLTTKDLTQTGVQKVFLIN